MTPPSNAPGCTDQSLPVYVQLGQRLWGRFDNRSLALVFLLTTAVTHLWATSAQTSALLWVFSGFLYASGAPPLLYKVKHGDSAPHRQHLLMLLVWVFPMMELIEWWGTWAPASEYRWWAELSCLLLFLYFLGQFASQELRALEWRAGAIGLGGDSIMISTACVVICLLLAYQPLIELWQHHGWSPLWNLAYLTSGFYMGTGIVMVIVMNRYRLSRRDRLLIGMAVLTFAFFLVRCLSAMAVLTPVLWWQSLSHVLIAAAGSCVMVYAELPEPQDNRHEIAPISQISASNWIGTILLVCALPVAWLLTQHRPPEHIAPIGWWIICGAACAAAGAARLLPLLKQALFWQQRYRHMALHDQLTDLPNRWALVGLEKQWRQQFGHSHDVAVFGIDLDDFKSINDLYGHHTGDLLLCTVARELQEVKAQWQASGYPSAWLIRMGGDEFTLLMLSHKGQLSQAKAVEMARALHKRMARWWVLPNSEPVFCKVSIGVDVRPLGDWTEAFRQADLRMYQAKSNHSAPLDSAPSPPSPQPRQQIREWTHKALSQPVIPLDLQAIVCAHTLQIKGYEVLARLAHPEHAEQRLYPGAFLNVIDSDNLHELLCTRVIETLATHRDALRRCSLSINIIPDLIATPASSQWLHGLIIQHGFNPQRITLEILEARVTSCGDLTASLTWLRQQGYCLAMDDFGAGYSNLHRLVQWPFDQLKIDRSVVDAASEGDLSVLSSIRSLAQSRGMKLVAEGVSSTRQLTAIQATGIEFMQGFLHSRPQPLQYVVDYLSELGLSGAEHA